MGGPLAPYRNIRNIPRYVLSAGASEAVPSLLESRRATIGSGGVTAPVFLIDQFFRNGHLHRLAPLGMQPADVVRFVSTAEEPTTQGVDALIDDLRSAGHGTPCAIVGVGGGVTLDTAKAIANLYTNP